MAIAEGLHFLNNQDVSVTWGIAVSEGKIDFLNKGKRKDGYEANWPERHGTDADLGVAYFEDVDVNLRCVAYGPNALTIIQNLNNFRTELNKPGWQSWRVTDHNNESYHVRFRDMVSWSATSKRLSTAGDTLVHVSFTLVLTKTLNPTQSTNTVTIRNPDGSVLIVLQPGSSYQLQGSATADATATVTNVTVNQNTVTITGGTNPAGLPLEYSLRGTYQSSNVFNNVSPGTYSNVRVRIVGTGTEGVWPNPVVVTWAPPAAPPDAPTNPVTDNVNKTFGWTPTPGFPEPSLYQYTLNGGSTALQVISNPQPVGGGYAAGQVGVRVAAANGRDASPWLFNTQPFSSLPVFNTSLVSGQEAWGVSYQGRGDTIFHFTGPAPDTFLSPSPAIMPIRENGNVIGTVFHQPVWVGRQCAIEIGGIMEYFTFIDGYHDLN